MAWYNIFEIKAHHIFHEGLNNAQRADLLSVGIDVDSYGNIKPMWVSDITSSVLRALPALLHKSDAEGIHCLNPA